MGLRRCRLLVFTSFTLLGPVACTERVPTTPTLPTTPTSPTTPTCTYDISPMSRIHGPAAETGTVSVTAPSGCAWTASSGVSWIAVTSGGSGTGNGTVTYAVEANSGAGRTGTLAVAGRSVRVDQAMPACRLDVIADVSRWAVESASTGTVRVSDQHVELRAATGQGHAGIVSPCALQGDFDVQVDYALINWPTGNSYGLRLATSGGRYGIYRTGGGFYSLYLVTALIGQARTNDTRGQLRLVRTGASIAGYYSNGSGWTNLGATNVGSEPVSLALDLSSQTPSTPSELIITFDNFRINFGTPAN